MQHYQGLSNEPQHSNAAVAMWRHPQQSNARQIPQYLSAGWNAVQIHSQPSAQQLPQNMRPLYRQGQSPPPLVRPAPPGVVDLKVAAPRQHRQSAGVDPLKRFENTSLLEDAVPKKGIGNAKACMSSKCPGDMQAEDFLAGTEKAIRMDFDPETRQWKKSAVVLRLEPKCFAVGSMRSAYKMEDLTIRSGPNMFVAKVSRDPKTDRSTYFSDVETQTEAKLWAERFNARIGKQAIQPVVDFLVAYVAVLVERPGAPVIGVEKMVHGDYVKYNNNWDWSDDRRNTPQAFSHFTWEESGHTILVCDIQGVGNLWTDPQMHSVDGKRYSSGNMGMRGINAFLNNHRCNALCRALKLPPTGMQEPKPDGGTVYRTEMQEIAEADLESCQTCAQVLAQQLSLSMPSPPQNRDAGIKEIDFNRICIKVVNASGLIGVDSRRVPDAMVVVCLGTQTAQTRIIFNSANPVWDEILEMRLSSGSKVEKLVCVVFDSSAASHPAIIGVVRIPLNMLDETDGRHWALDPPPNIGHLPPLMSSSSQDRSLGKLHLRILCFDSKPIPPRYSEASNCISAKAGRFPDCDNSLLAQSFASRCGDGTTLKPSAMLGGLKRLMGWLRTGSWNGLSRPIDEIPKTDQAQNFLGTLESRDTGDERRLLRVEVRRARQLSLPWACNMGGYISGGSCPPAAYVADIALFIRLRMGVREASTSSAKVRWGKPGEGGECTWDQSFVFPCLQSSTNVLLASLVRLDARTGGEEVLGKLSLKLSHLQYDGKGMGSGWVALEGQPAASLLLQVWRPISREPSVPSGQEIRQKPLPTPPAELLISKTAPPAAKIVEAKWAFQADEPSQRSPLERRPSVAPTDVEDHSRPEASHPHDASWQRDAEAAESPSVNGSNSAVTEEQAEWWSVPLPAPEATLATSSDTLNSGFSDMTDVRGSGTGGLSRRTRIDGRGKEPWQEESPKTAEQDKSRQLRPEQTSQRPPLISQTQQRQLQLTSRTHSLLSARQAGATGPSQDANSNRNVGSAWDKLCLVVEESGERNLYC